MQLTYFFGLLFNFIGRSFSVPPVISDLFIECKFLALQNVFITLSGAWKLGGFGFAIAASQNSDDSSNLQAFHYAVS